MAINKLVINSSTTNEMVETVNGLVDLKDAQVINGDTAVATLATKALTLDGQVLMERTEGTVNETNRPVWVDMNYYFKPTSSPLSDIDYHGVDIYGDVHVDSYSVPLTKAQLYLFESKSFYSGQSTIRGNYAGFLEASNNSTGTVKDNCALRLWSRNRSTGHVENLYGIRMTATQNFGTVDNSYGIYLHDISGATNTENNYSIYTNAGKVRLGGNTSVNGTLTTSSDSFSTSVTSAIDTTTGRHLRVGDFGIGSGDQESGIDLDTINVSRSFSGNNFTNAPTADYYYIRCTYHSNDYSEQWASGLAGATKDNVFRRVKNSGAWGAWRQLAFI